MHGYDVEKKYMEAMRSAYKVKADDKTYRGRLLNSDYTLRVSDFCGDYGWSTRKMNKWMGDHGIQYKRAKGACWIPSLMWEKLGLVYMENRDYYGRNGMIQFSCVNYWSPMARVLIYDLLRSEGILPVEEREENRCVSM